jgi:hypothetical protein
VEIEKENETEETKEESRVTEMHIKTKDNATQTYKNHEHVAYSIERFSASPEIIRYLTGFNSYKHLMLLYNFLLPDAENLQYKPRSLTPLNQLFMTLIKLRQNKDEMCLSIDFNVSRQTVAKTVNQWINFLYLELSEVNWWQDRATVDAYFPHQFSKSFAKTRIVLDATEIPIEKPTNIQAQRMTFSVYKNRNTLKLLVGVSPRGQVTFVSECYGGSTSDRQIIERSDLVRCCESFFDKKDAIMADRGIMVQDLFSHLDVHVNTPTTMKGRNQLPSAIVAKDRKIASKRIHVERIIGLAKTYKILTFPLSSQKTELANRIIKLCFYLVNFRGCIVGENA